MIGGLSSPFGFVILYHGISWASQTSVSSGVVSATTGGDVKRAAIEYGDGPAVDADDVGTG